MTIDAAQLATVQLGTVIIARSLTPASNLDTLARAWSVLGGSVLFVSGAGILKGANWARVLFTSWAAISFVLGGVLFGPAPIPIVSIIIVYFLCTRDASEYFGGPLLPPRPVAVESQNRGHPTRGAADSSFGPTDRWLVLGAIALSAVMILLFLALD